jgi:molecular chaperone DnaK (HSP70)
MSDETNGAPERFAIGISFGNTSSSIARINPVCEPASRLVF